MRYYNMDLWLEEASLNITDNDVVETNDSLIKKHEIYNPQMIKQHKTKIFVQSYYNLF